MCVSAYLCSASVVICVALVAPHDLLSFTDKSCEIQIERVLSQLDFRSATFDCANGLWGVVAIVRHCDGGEW